jgi:Leucine-rich repeat (LRR) protein
MYDPNFWTWTQPHSLMETLESDRVTAVKSIELREDFSFLVIELSRSATEGDKNWRATKTSSLHGVKREGISAQDIFLNPKMRSLQTLTLSEFDRSVIDDVSVLAKLTTLKSLNLSKTKIENISALEHLTNLKWLSLRITNVENVSALAKLTKLESLNLDLTSVANMSTLNNLTNLKELNLLGTKVSDVEVSALKNKRIVFLSMPTKV